MAALSEAQPLELVDLRRISAADLSHLLEHELRDWRRSLDWDFRLAPESGVKARKKIAASDALA